MTKLLAILRCRRVGNGLVLLAFATLCASAATPKRVLILDSFGRDVAPFSIGVSAFRTTLARELGQPVDIYEAPLDMARFPDAGFEKPLVDFLEQRFAGSSVDLVVPVGGPAVRFAAQYRKRLFAETPILFMGADPRGMPPDALNTNATLVTEKADLPGVIEDILQLQPDTTNIVVVFGVSPIEKFWAGEFRREWQPFTNRLAFSWLDTLPLPQILERVQKLPPRSFIVIPMVLMDADRVPYDGYEAFEAIHAAANAPVFGCYKSQLGRGAIGGRLYQDSKVGTLAARFAIRILRGEKAGDIPPEIIGPSPPTYDWRELTRWGIRPERLPEGSVIEFREPTFWGQHRWRIVGVVAFCCLQTVLIVGLIMNRAKQRQEEAMARLIAELSSRFINLSADKVDPEIEAAQRRICECLRLDISALWQWTPHDPDDLLLTHVCRLLDGPPIPEPMSAREYFPWLLQEAKAKRRFVLASLADAPQEAARDVQVLRHFGIKADLTIPMAAGEGPTLGVVSFNTVRAERTWPKEVVERLEVVAQIFANALARKRADQELRESEARLNLAADSAGAGLWVLDCATRVFWTTEKARGIFGYAPGEIVSMERFEASVHPNDLELVRRAIERALQDPAPINLDYRILLGDGTIRWVVSRGRTFFRSTGEPERLMGVSIDITEQKRTSEALYQSEEQYRRLFEQMHSGIIVLEVILDQAGNPVDHRLLQANAEFEAQTGLKRSEQVGKTSAELSFQWPEEVRRRYYQVALGGKPLHWERFNEGLQRYYDVRVFSPRRGQFAVLFHDVTERKRIEEALKASEQRFRTLTETSLVGIYVLQEGRYAYVNPAFARVFGYSVAEMTGMSPSVLMQPCDHGTLDENIRRRITGEVQAIQYQVRTRRKDGSTRDVEVYGSRMDMNGVPALVGTLIDITERKRAEEALRDFSARFISAQEQERSRLARELHDDITQRLARLAIDVGQCEKRTPKNRAIESLRAVREGLVQLSEDVHALSYRLHPSILEDLGLAEALKAEADRFEQQGANPIQVKMQDIPETVSPQTALCLFRVAQEALRNAARHASAREITLSLRGLDGGLQLAIQDDGCGFDATLKRDRHSLGLASMRERVHLAGGELDIESAPGHGTTILAWVPMKRNKA